MPALSIVVPAYNEAARLGPSLDRIRSAIAGRDVELIVVDDGSTDATAEIASAAGAHLVQLPRNRGKGAAVRTGVLAARGDRILICDADLSTPIEELARLEAAVDAGADIAIGSRRVAPTIEREQPWARRILGAGFRVAARWLVGVTERDPMCGFKLFKRAAARDLFARCHIDRFAFDVEVLSLARRRWQVVEVPVRWQHVSGSKVSLGRDGLRSARDVVVLFVHHRLRR
ncbi:MAG TPA: dolichyl-phosphate beta-glucosyltransferase [Kofleriaceae bacterium]|nr:dolichyl-phosphate beta-glucosyltransferase [Kofleriaceae bacterium]